MKIFTQKLNHTTRVNTSCSTQSRFVGSVVILLVGIFLLASTAQAVPAFARKHQMQCSNCHTAFPALNAAGRTYKENGFRFSNEDDKSFMSWDQTLPLSVVIKARPYEKQEGKAKTLRALHEVELIAAGVMGKQFSGFFEFEAEDDAGTFAPSMPVADLTYHVNPSANVQVSWAPILWSDPYATYSDARKLTRNRTSVIDSAFGGTGGKLRKPSQNINLYGRVAEQFFYSVGISGVTGDDVASDSTVTSARVAMDVTPNIMVGLLNISGTCKSSEASCAVNRDFSRSAIDAQANFGDINVKGAYLTATDDNAAATADVKNNAAYVEASYVIKKDGRPSLVPLVRLDQAEKNDGADKVNVYVLQLNHYFTENGRAFIEYQSTDDDTKADTVSKITLQADVAF